VVVLAALVSFYYTDIWQGGAVTGGLLPLLDFVLVLYLVGLFVLGLYRRKTTKTVSADGLDAKMRDAYISQYAQFRKEDKQ